MLPQWQRCRLPMSSLNPAACNYCNELQPAESHCCVHTPKRRARLSTAVPESTGVALTLLSDVVNFAECFIVRSFGPVLLHQPQRLFDIDRRRQPLLPELLLYGNPVR